MVMNEFERRYALGQNRIPYGAYIDGTFSHAGTCAAYMQFLDANGKLITNSVKVRCVLYDPDGTAIEAIVANTGTTAFAIATKGLLLDKVTAAGEFCSATALTAAVTTEDSTPTSGNAALGISVENDQAEVVTLKVFNVLGDLIVSQPLTFS